MIRRAYGPYFLADRNRYAVVFKDSDGSRWRKSYVTEAEALGAQMEFNGGAIVRPAKGRPMPPRRTSVYFLRAAAGPIKIGVTSSLSHRLLRLQTANGRDLRVILVIPGDRAVESALHALFKKERMNGEWFRPSRRLLDFIARCDRAAAAALAETMVAPLLPEADGK